MLWHKKDRNNGGDRRKFQRARKRNKIKSGGRNRRSFTREEIEGNGKLREWQPPATVSGSAKEEASMFTTPEAETEIWDTEYSSPETAASGSGYRNYTIEIPERVESREVMVPETVEKEASDSDTGIEFPFVSGTTPAPRSENSLLSGTEGDNKEDDFDFDFDDADVVEPPLPSRDTVPLSVMQRGIDFDVATKVQPSEKLKESLRRIKGG